MRRPSALPFPFPWAHLLREATQEKGRDSGEGDKGERQRKRKEGTVERETREKSRRKSAENQKEQVSGERGRGSERLHTE